jgi:hypothetical protein
MAARPQVLITMKNGDEEIYYKPEDRGIYLSVNGCGYLVVEIGQGCVCKKDLTEVASVNVMTEKGWLTANFLPYELHHTTEACL